MIGCQLRYAYITLGTFHLSGYMVSDIVNKSLCCRLFVSCFHESVVINLCDDWVDGFYVVYLLQFYQVIH